MDGQDIRGAQPDDIACDPWDGKAAEALVSLETIAPLRYRSRFGDGNLNGRSYGGQILGQAMMAATLSAPDDRPAAMLQLLFLRGADPTRRITLRAGPPGRQAILLAPCSRQPGRRARRAERARHVLRTAAGSAARLAVCTVRRSGKPARPEHDP
ncbi:hypothetical protein [Bradyrhizobium acaciae]|uniref:hypothetical protein n=1 Tax=Bradyrhizobium acaciae TaxID=2683706 RepID=UPI0030840636